MKFAGSLSYLGAPRKNCWRSRQVSSSGFHHSSPSFGPSNGALQLCFCWKRLVLTLLLLSARPHSCATNPYTLHTQKRYTMISVRKWVSDYLDMRVYPRMFASSLARPRFRSNRVHGISLPWISYRCAAGLMNMKHEGWSRSRRHFRPTGNIKFRPHVHQAKAKAKRQQPVTPSDVMFVEHC